MPGSAWAGWREQGETAQGPVLAVLKVCREKQEHLAPRLRRTPLALSVATVGEAGALGVGQRGPRSGGGHCGRLGVGPRSGGGTAVG